MKARVKTPSRFTLAAIVIALIPLVTTCGSERATGPGHPGPATQIALQAGNNQTATVGTPVAVGPSVVVRDANGNAVPGVAVNWSVASGGGSVSAASTTTGSGGVTSVSWTLGLQTGANTVRAAASGLTGSPITFTATGVPGPASAATSIVSVSRSSAPSGGTVTLTLQTKDAAGNSLTAGGATVVFTASGGTSTGTIGATTDNGNGSYTAIFTGLVAGTATTIRATVNGTAVTTALPTLTVTAGAATQLVFTTQPVSTTAGASIGVVVTAQDAHGNTAAGFIGTVGLAITGGTGTAGAALLGTTSVVAATGVATFSGLNIDKTGTGYTLTASATGPSGVTSGSFDITPSAAGQLVFTTQPASTTAGASIGVVVTARDAQGNTATGFAGAVTVAIVTNPGGGRLNGTASVTAVAGVATFTGLSIDKSGTGYTLTASATGPSSAMSGSFDITAGTASALVFTTQPVSTTAGASIGVVVTARDALGNTATGFTGAVTVAIETNPGGGALSGTATVTARTGVATFAGLSIDRSDTGYTLTASATGPASATSTSFGITPGTASQLVFTTEPPSTTAGAGFGVVVTARDALGNTATDFTGAVTLVIGTNPGSGALSGAPSVTAVAGVATFTGLSIDKSGTGYTLTASIPGPISASSNAFNIIVAAVSATRTTVSAASTTVTASSGSSAATITVTVRDPLDNPVSGLTVTLAATGTGNTLVQPALSDANGVATGAFSSRSAGPHTVSATLGGVVATQQPTVTVSPASAAVLAFLVHPTDVVAGVAVVPAVQVEVRDAFANRVTSSTDPVSVALATNPGGGTLGGVLTQSATAGVATFADLTVNRAAAGYRLAATSGTLTGTPSDTFAVTARTASALVFTTEPVSTTAGAGFGVVVTARDALGNTATGFAGAVTVTIGTNPGGGRLSGTASVTAVAGVATFTGLSIDKSGTGYTLTASAAGPSTATSRSFDITPSAAGQLVFTTQPVSTTAGASIGVVVTARDALGNTATGFTGAVTVAIGTNPGGGTLRGTASVTAVAGVATFTGLSIEKSGTGYTLMASATGPASATSTSFNITIGAAALLTKASGDYLSGPVVTVLGTYHVVRVADTYGNPVPGVAVAWAVGTSGGSVSRLAGTTNAQGRDSTLRTLGQTAGPQTTTATATLGGVPTTVTFNITATVGGASRMVLNGGDGQADTVGATLPTALSVLVTDASSNPVSGVLITWAVTGGGGSVSPLTSLTNAAGIATTRWTLGTTTTATDSVATVQATGVGTPVSFVAVKRPGAVSASQSTVGASPGSIVAGSGTTTVTVTARDGFGNPIPNKTVVLAVTGSENILTQPAVNTNASGVATGTLSSTAAEAKAVSATISGVAIAHTAAVTVTPGAISLALSTVAVSAGTVASDSAVTLTLQAKDASGNDLTVGGETVVFTATGGTSTGTIGGTSDHSDGIYTASFTGVLAGTATTIGATINTVPVSSTLPTLTVTAGAAASVTKVGDGQSVTAGTAVPTAPSVIVRDANSNPVSGVSVTFAVATGGGTVTPVTALTTDASGIAQVTSWTLGTTAGSNTLTATAGSLSPVTFTATGTVGAATQLSITQQPSVSAQSGAVFGQQPAVQLQDASGNAVSGVVVTAALASGEVALGGTLTATTDAGGVATFTGLKITGTIGNRTLSFSASGLTSAASTAITITAGAASAATSTVSRAPASLMANGSATSALTVQLKDASGNNLTGSGGTVTFVATTLGSISSEHDNENGTWTATYTAGAVTGVETITPRLDGTSFTNTTTVTLTAGAATQIALNGGDGQSARTGTAVAIAPAVLVRDANGNPVSDVSVAFAAATGGGSVTGGTVSTDGSGIATVGSWTLGTTAGSNTLTATSAGLSGSPVTFTATGTASQLVLTTLAAGAASGAAFTTQPVVAVRDAAGNTITTDNSTVVTMTASTGATVVGTATATAVSGVATFTSVGISGIAGTEYTLTFASGALTPATQAITPTAGRATRLLFNQQPAGTTAGAIIPTVKVWAVDAAGNLDTLYVFGVTLAITPGTGADGAVISGNSPTGAVAGVATFSALSIDRAGTYTLDADYIAPAPYWLARTTSSSFTITTP